MHSSQLPIVVLGASAGGVKALTSVVGKLPRDFEAAVFIVLHVPAHSPSQLASVLQRVSRLPIKDAEDNEPILPGSIYVARADRHLLLEPDRIRVTRGPKESRARPAVDALFRSAAVAFGPRVVGVVLSGTLDDGTAGVWAIKDRGGIVLVQDPRSAEYGCMAESAIEHVAVDKVVQLEGLAAEIVRAVSTVPRTHSGTVSDRMHVENVIALEGNGLQAGVMKLGRVSKYTCPDCHGVLVQIEEGTIVRFRCHTGHAFSLKTLLAEVDQSIDQGLWETLRAVEERILLLRETADLSVNAGRIGNATKYRFQADETERRVGPLRELLLDSTWLGPSLERD